MKGILRFTETESKIVNEQQQKIPDNDKPTANDDGFNCTKCSICQGKPRLSEALEQSFFQRFKPAARKISENKDRERQIFILVYVCKPLASLVLG